METWGVIQAAVEALLGDRELRSGMGQAAGTRIVVFCRVNIVARYVEVYERFRRPPDPVGGLLEDRTLHLGRHVLQAANAARNHLLKPRQRASAGANADSRPACFDQSAGSSTRRIWVPGSPKISGA